MAEKIVVPCEIIIEPGGAGRQTKITLSTSGETVVDGYEANLDKGVRFTVGLIVEAHARMLAKWCKGA